MMATCSNSYRSHRQSLMVLSNDDPMCWCAAGSRTKLFQACVGACRFDMQLALHLLPYVVQNVVSNGSDEARHGVQMEVWLSEGYVVGLPCKRSVVSCAACAVAGFVCVRIEQ